MRKILVSAYGCEPFRGSEAGVGWNWILQMARYNELFVIARKNDKEKIEESFPKEYYKTLHFYYYDTCPFLMKVKKKEKGLYLYYWFWQIGIIPVVKKIIQEHQPDYTMHLTFGSLWMPTFLPFFRVPFIWGPVGGGDGVPPKMLSVLPLKQRIIQSLRYILIMTSWINPLVAIPSKKASLILCRTENNRDAIPKKYRRKCEIVLETAMDDNVFLNKKIDDKNKEIVEIITTGRLVPFKNTILALESINRLHKKHSNIHMTIIGNGSERNRLLEYIRVNHLEQFVQIISEIPREQVLKKLCSADIFVFPSLREGGSWALMEALAVGLPAVCLDWTGMKVIVNKECGILANPGNYSKVLDDFTDGIDLLIENPELRKTMGENSRNRIRKEFNWERIGNRFEDIMTKYSLL